jgi:hypothetical protein
MHRRDRMPLKSLNDSEYEDVRRVYLEIAGPVKELIGS